MISEQMTNKYNNYDINNGFWEDWIELLCTYGDYNDYLEIEFNSISKPIAIMEYRGKLYQEGIGDVGRNELVKTYLQKTKEELHILFEYMFLEPIQYDKFRFILNKLQNTDNGIEKLYERWNDNKGIRIMSIILTL